MLEADENGDGFHDDEDFEVDTPKRKHRNKGRVSDEHDSSKSAEGVKEKRQVRARKKSDWDRDGGLTPEREIKHEREIPDSWCVQRQRKDEEMRNDLNSDYVM